MPQHDRTPDVEHLFFSDLPPLEPIHESESAQPLGPLAIYMGCHPAAGRPSAPAEEPDERPATTDDSLEGGWPELTLNAPRVASWTFPSLWHDLDE